MKAARICPKVNSAMFMKLQNKRDMKCIKGNDQIWNDVTKEDRT